jgi:CRP/FNR family transcriptional regulator, cyclic AMP receptor protein
MGVMRSPYGFGLIESCLSCKLRGDHTFCDLSASALQQFETIKHATIYPADAVLFVEGQAPRGIFVVCKGRVKVSFSSMDGKTLILRIAEAGEVLGISSSVSGKPYQLTAETLDPCQISFVKHDDFMQFMKEHSDVCLRVAEELSNKYHSACRELRSHGLSNSAGKLAKLLLEWSTKNGESTKAEPRVTLGLTHEEIGQMIGASRETVTRLFAKMKKRQIVQFKGSTLVIRDNAALKALATE